VERELALIATRSHGVVSRKELRVANITEREIDYRLATGALIREYPGVYRVGHRAPSLEARYTAAVKACGEGAVLSGRAAARLLGLIKGTPPDPEVTAPRQRRVAGVRVRRERRGIDPRDVTTWLGIPTTTVPRTVMDLASMLSFDALARAFHEAGIRHGITPTMVEATLARRPNTPGAAGLRRVLGGEEPVILSRLESRFRAVLRHDGLALPQTNRPVGTRYVDCRWPELKLTVELDGYTYHSSRHAWEQDRRREREARARGDDFRRYTYGDVFEDPAQMLAELRALLPKARPARA
jgi:very-short-patch-repair endonuclease